VLDSLETNLEIPLRCPACMKVHKWRRKDAWVDKADAQIGAPGSGISARAKTLERSDSVKHLSRAFAQKRALAAWTADSADRTVVRSTRKADVPRCV
jgi:hypothetical protein